MGGCNSPRSPLLTPISQGQIMEQVYTVQEVASLLKVGYRTVLDQINMGRLEAYQISNRYRISESSVLKYLSANKVKRVAI